MNKRNRRNTFSPFQNICLQQNSPIDKWAINYPDKQNQAKIALLDMGNDDTMFHVQSILAQQNPSRNTLIHQIKAHKAQTMFKRTQNQVMSVNEIYALLPLDNNCNFQLDNFVEDKLSQTAQRKQIFSLRNTPFIRSKQNLIPLRKELQGKKQQKNILKLKKILKKLESPQKPRNHQQQNYQQNDQDIKKKKKSVNKIAQFCTQYLYRNVSSSKQNAEPDFGSHQKPLQNHNEFPPQTVKFYEFRTGSKTSHQKHRASLSKVSGTSTPTSFFYKPTKLTNKNMLLKRNSITAGELVSQKNYNPAFRKTSARMIHQVSRTQIERKSGEEMFMQNEKMREERKSRNLKNILFD